MIQGSVISLILISLTQPSNLLCSFFSISWVLTFDFRELSPLLFPPVFVCMFYIAFQPWFCRASRYHISCVFNVSAVCLFPSLCITPGYHCLPHLCVGLYRTSFSFSPLRDLQVCLLRLPVSFVILWLLAVYSLNCHFYCLSLVCMLPVVLFFC